MTFLVPSLLLTLFAFKSYLNSWNGNDATPATWSSISLTHGEAYHKMSSAKLVIHGESDYVHAWRQKDITLN